MLTCIYYGCRLLDVGVDARAEARGCSQASIELNINSIESRPNFRVHSLNSALDSFNSALNWLNSAHDSIDSTQNFSQCRL